VRDPNGNTSAFQQASSPTVFRDVFALAVTGTYTVTVDPRDTQVGTLTFRLNSVPDNVGTTTIGTPTTVTIGTIGEVAIRTFTATAGQKLTLTVTGNTIPVADVTVRDPNGNTSAFQQASSPTVFRDVFTLSFTGAYTVIVDPRDTQVGTLTFTLNTVPDNVGTTTIGTPTTVTIGTAGEIAVRTFTGTAGQSVSLAVTGNTIPGVDLTVLNPSGASIATLFASGATATRSAFTLPVTGSYTITIDPRFQLVGGLTFTVVPN
jgi:hypothetical protein